MMKFAEVLKEMFTQEKAIHRLQRELDAPIVDKMGSLVAVKRGSMEKEWGLPVLRHTSKDWYDLQEIRRRRNEIKRGDR